MYEILLKFPNKIKRKKVKNPTHASWAEIFPGLVLFLHFFSYASWLQWPSLLLPQRSPMVQLGRLLCWRKYTKAVFS
jgi:hypothetical protein